jgi:hypothetical protein
MRSISVALVLFSLAVAFRTPATAQSVTVPEPGVPESVRSGLRADGFEICGFVPQLLTASDVNDAALLVSFDQDITKVVGIRVGHLKWDDLPGVLADYARGRDAIVSQLDALVDALAPGDSP